MVLTVFMSTSRAHTPHTHYAGAWATGRMEALSGMSTTTIPLGDLRDPQVLARWVEWFDAKGIDVPTFVPVQLVNG